MPVKKGKMPKKSAKEMIYPDNKRITIFCIRLAGFIGGPAGVLTTLIKWPKLELR